MPLLPITLVAGLLVLTGAGIDQFSSHRRRRAARVRWQMETTALEDEIEKAEILRHESELRTGEFDMQG